MKKNIDLIKLGSDFHIESITSVRSRLLKGMQVAISIIGLPVTIIACLEANKYDQFGGMLLYSASYTIVAICTIFSKRIPFNLNAGFLLISLYLISVFNLLTFSFSGAGIELGITISVLTTVLFGTRGGIFISLIFFISLLVIGLGFILGGFGVGPNMPATTTQMISWLTAAATFALFSGALVLSSGMLQDHLIKALSSLKLNAEKIEKTNSNLIVEIKQREKTQNELFQSEKKFRGLFESISDLIFTQDMEGRFLSTNPAMQKLFGCTEKEFVGHKAAEFMKQEIDACYEPKYLNMIKKHGYYEGVSSYFKKDGSKIYIDHRISVVTPTQGESYISGIGRDITEKIKSERKLKQLEAKIVQSQKMETIGTLAGGIAHDFNNILFPILGYTEMMLSEVSDDNPMHESLKKIYSGGMRAAALVKQILTFSRQEPHHLTLLKIQPIIKESLKLLRSTIPTTIKFNQNIHEGNGLVKADPTHMHQVIMNLVTNAYHAMEEKGGELGVSLEEIKLTKTDLINPQMSSGNYLCLKVSDTGSGMDKVLQNKIFDPFFTTKEKGKGTGMGLSVVHGIVTQMRGAIDVNSEPGRGTVFKVYLPVENGKTVEQTSQSELNLKAGNESILVVDDDKAVLDMEKNMLERLGYQVTARTSSIEALEAFRADPDKFDAVITDMTMLNMTGDQLSRKVMEIRPEIPVIICTGFSERIDRETAKTIGVKCLLMKPVIISELSQQLRSVLDESENYV